MTNELPEYLYISFFHSYAACVAHTAYSLQTRRLYACFFDYSRATWLFSVIYACMMTIVIEKHIENIGGIYV